MRILAGDIGGTKTTLAVFSTAQDLHTPLAEQTFPSGQYDSLEAIVQNFLAQIDSGEPLQAACFGVAGPVVKGRARITNLPWIIDRQHLCDTFTIPAVGLLNDLESIAHAVPNLQPDDIYTLNEGEAVEEGTIGIIAPGTGLGEAFLTWNGIHYQPHASEGGHASFAPRNTTESQMLSYLWQTYDHVSYERVCSGKGLPNIYAFFRDTLGLAELPHVAQRLATAQDLTPIIVQAALDEASPSPICQHTLQTFVSILGAEAGNLALKVLATGGIYLGGGIPPRILPQLKEGSFMQTFLHKGRFADMLRNIPVHIILNNRTALLGAAHYGLHLHQQQREAQA